MARRRKRGPLIQSSTEDLPDLAWCERCRGDWPRDRTRKGGHPITHKCTPPDPRWWTAEERLADLERRVEALEQCDHPSVSHTKPQPEPKP